MSVPARRTRAVATLIIEWHRNYHHSDKDQNRRRSACSRPYFVLTPPAPAAPAVAFLRTFFLPLRTPRKGNYRCCGFSPALHFAVARSATPLLPRALSLLPAFLPPVLPSGAGPPGAARLVGPSAPPLRVLFVPHAPALLAGHSAVPPALSLQGSLVSLLPSGRYSACSSSSIARASRWYAAMSSSSLRLNSPRFLISFISL